MMGYGARMRTAIFVALLLLAACPGDPCAQKSPCPNDPALTPDEISQCDQQLQDGVRCAEESKALLQCINSKSQCTSGGITDSTKLSMDCKPQFDAKTACVTAVPTDGGP